MYYELPEVWKCRLHLGRHIEVNRGKHILHPAFVFEKWGFYPFFKGGYEFQREKRIRPLHLRGNVFQRSGHSWDSMKPMKPYERPPKPPTIRNSFTRTLVLDTIMKLSGTIGVTQKTMTLIHMFASFWIWRHSSSKLISARNEASKNILKLRAKKRDIISCTKWTHLKNWKVKGNSERWPKRWPNDDHFLSFWVLIDTSPQRAHNGFLAGKKLFYSFSLLLLLLFLLLLLVLLLLLLFVSITCSFHVHEHQTLRNDRGHTKNDDHFSHVLSRM